MNTTPVSDLTDTQLLTEVTRLSRCEREATAVLITHLAELDHRRLYLGAGCRSLFVYCTEVLGLSEHEAYNRIEAARLSRRFPQIIGMVAQGSLNVTAVRLLAPHLTEGNSTTLLGEALGKGKRGVEELLARHFPKPDVRESIRRVSVPSAPNRSSEVAAPAAADPADATAGASINSASAANEAATASEVTGTGIGPDLFARPTRPDMLRPLAEDRYEVRFTASRATCEKLKLAKDLLRHRIPNGDTAEVIDRALTTLLEDLARRKFAATSQPRSKGAHVTRAGSRHIPAQVKRTVWLRDGGRCAFVAKGGRHCGQRGFLEFHHLRPHAVGGPATVENIELRCRPHNAYEAELYYGPGVREGGEHAGEVRVEQGGVEKGGATGIQLVPERVEPSRSPI